MVLGICTKLRIVTSSFLWQLAPPSVSHVPVHVRNSSNKVLSTLCSVYTTITIMIYVPFKGLKGVS